MLVLSLVKRILRRNHLGFGGEKRAGWYLYLYLDGRCPVGLHPLSYLYRYNYVTQLTLVALTLAGVNRHHFQFIYFPLMLVIECLHYKGRASELSFSQPVIDGEILQFKANIDLKMTVNSCKKMPYSHLRCDNTPDVLQRPHPRCSCFIKISARLKRVHF